MEVQGDNLWPDDIIREIFESVDAQSLLSCGRVCRQWKMLAEIEFFQRGKREEKRSNFTLGACFNRWMLVSSWRFPLTLSHLQLFRTILPPFVSTPHSREPTIEEAMQSTF